jgi:CheY-like chemotaxis protein
VVNNFHGPNTEVFASGQGALVAGELILIIEDNEKNRKLIRDLLQAKGYQTIESDAAEQGLKLAEERCPLSFSWIYNSLAWMGSAR